MRIEIPEFALVALIGATSSGKTSFARRFFKETEILSSDFFRGMTMRMTKPCRKRRSICCSMPRTSG